MTSRLDTSSSSDENTLYQLNTIKDNDMDYDIESDQDYAMDKYSEESSDYFSDFDDIDLHDGVEGDDDNDSSNDYKWIKGDLATHLPNFQGAFSSSENIHLPSSPSPIDIFTLFLTPV